VGAMPARPGLAGASDRDQEIAPTSTSTSTSSQIQVRSGQVRSGQGRLRSRFEAGGAAEETDAAEPQEEFLETAPGIAGISPLPWASMSAQAARAASMPRRAPIRRRKSPTSRLPLGRHALVACQPPQLGRQCAQDRKDRHPSWRRFTIIRDTRAASPASAPSMSSNES